MRIAVPSMGEDIHSTVSGRLGRCRYIFVYNTKSKEHFAVPNPGLLLQDGSGIKTAEVVIRTGADTLLSPEVGVKAYSVLIKQHVKIHLINSASSVKDALKKFSKK